jgi:hypothetical protein
MPLSSVQQCNKQQEFYSMYTTMYCLTASYKQNLGSSTFWQSCYCKYVKKIRIRKDAYGVPQNILYCIQINCTMNATPFFLLHLCILTRLQCYDTRYFNTTNWLIIHCFKYCRESATDACTYSGLIACVCNCYIQVIGFIKSITGYLFLTGVCIFVFSSPFCADLLPQHPCLLTFCHLGSFSESGSQSVKLFLVVTKWMAGL